MLDVDRLIYKCASGHLYLVETAIQTRPFYSGRIGAKETAQREISRA